MGSQDKGGEGRAQSLMPIGLVRGAGGALIFSLPMLMTMEMWQLGVTGVFAWRRTPAYNCF